MQTQTLAEKAMLVKLSISQWSGRVHDKKVSREVADNHSTSEDAGRYHKAAMAKEHLKSVQQQATESRADYYKHSLPWTDTGWRIVTAVEFENFAAMMRQHQSEFMREYDQFCHGYQELVFQMREQLNGLFNEDDYPDATVIQDKFSFKVEVQALPMAADFRVDLPAAEVAKIRLEIDTRLNEAIEAANRDLWDRLYDAVSKMATSLPAFNPDEKGKARGTFRDSLVENVSELVDLLPRLNVTGDADLEKMRQEVKKKLTGVTAQGLRENETCRENAAASAAEIAESMAAFMGE